MKIDIVSVFPEYFEVMNLSLMGKAQAKGLLEIKAHNLRDWTHDVHHSVDDTPVGGGAGMVMKPEVWSECLDELLGFSQPSGSPAPSGAPVLIFPNPSAPLFTQRDATELSHADHLLFGCGRYEGYDARIPDYYRAQGVDVREYSIGDYVLNGGEVAVSVMLEAITRLMPDSWATQIRLLRNPTPARAHCLNIASTPNRPYGVVLRCRTCCCPATTARWTVFAATKRWPAPPRFGRTLSRHWIARRWIRPIARP